jgi:hypothetical protein
MADKAQSPSKTTPRARLAFTNTLKKPQKNQQGADQWGCTLIIGNPADLQPKDRALLAELRTAAMDALRAKFGDKAFVAGKDGKPKVAPGYDWPFHDGKDKAEKYKGFSAGGIYINVNTQRQPSFGVASVRDGKVVVEDVDNAEKFYPGCFGRGKVSAWAYDNKRKGVKFTLDGIVWMGDGERLDGGVGSVAQAFSEEEIDPSELGFDAAAADAEVDTADEFT